MINNLWCPNPDEAPVDMYYDKLESFAAVVVATGVGQETEPFVMASTPRTQVEAI